MKTTWESIHSSTSTHYNNFRCTDENGMNALRELFPEGDADCDNFVLFSTSGVHGTYTTIESAENDLSKAIAITFLVIQPRVCTMRHGVCVPQTREEIAFLKTLRETSQEAIAGIGIDPTPHHAKNR